MTVLELIKELNDLLLPFRFPAQTIDIKIMPSSRRDYSNGGIKLGDLTHITLKNNSSIVLHISEE